MKVLLVTNSTAHAASTATVAALTEMGHIVTAINESTLGSYTIPSDIDVITVVRATPATYGPWIAARWAEGWPVLLGGPENGVLDNSTTHYGETLGVVKDALVTATQNQNINTIAAHPILNGFTPPNTITFASSSTYSVRDMTDTPYGTAIASSGHTGVDTSIIAIETGDALASGTAPARLVFLGNLYGAVAYTADAKKVISQAADWAAGGQTKFLTEDTFTDSASPSLTNENSTFISATAARTPYIKFPAPVLGAGEVVISAKLQFVALGAGTAGTQINVLAPNANWTEANLNYNNRPAATQLGVISLPATTAATPYIVDITPYYNQPYGLAFTPVTTTGFSFYSTEHTTVAYRPVVIYEVGANPNVTVDVDLNTLNLSMASVEAVPETNAEIYLLSASRKQIASTGGAF